LWPVEAIANVCCPAFNHIGIEFSDTDIAGRAREAIVADFDGIGAALAKERVKSRSRAGLAMNCGLWISPLIA
jgi:hypothetical protein